MRLKIFIYIKHFLKGLYYGYPSCCIHQFAKEQMKDISSFQLRCSQFGWDLSSTIVVYVPCNKCALIRNIEYIAKSKYIDPISVATATINCLKYGRRKKLKFMYFKIKKIEDKNVKRL